MSVRRDLKDRGKETTDDDEIPRCQKILQGCELHEFDSNNIFVLVDTSVGDINDRISDPEGLLPAPGQPNLTKFPIGYHTQPRFLMIPYSSLTKRCEHGHPEPSLDPSCQICFPKYQAALARSNYINSRGRRGYRNVSPLFKLRSPPGF